MYVLYIVQLTAVNEIHISFLHIQTHAFSVFSVSIDAKLPCCVVYIYSTFMHTVCALHSNTVNRLI